MTSNILEWLEKTVEEYPNKIAVRDESGEISFSELVEQSKKIASLLISKEGNAIRKPIAVYMDKSIDALATFFGIVYSGNFYVPIDVEMPYSRMEKIFQTLKPLAILTKKDYVGKLGTLNGIYNCYTIDNLGEVGLAEKDIIESRVSNIINTDILYVIFTSGSTGTPKGVAIPHKGVINYIEWVEKTFSFSSDDSIGNQAPFYFDNSVLDIYTMVKTGATLYLIPRILFSQPVRLLEYMKVNRVNSIFWVPSALMMVSRLRAFKNVDLSDTLKRVLFAGEVMPTKQLNMWRQNIPNAVYANLYGPTEITVDCTCYVLDREFEEEEPIPIGNAITNTEILVLDESNQLVEKPDEVGELCVRGSGLAVGYYNNPNKTKEVFVQNPLNKVFDEIIYRTGDLVKYNRYGELVYVSRKDFQIKKAGHRIELGEIEAAVSSLDNVNACCCLYDEQHSRIVLILDYDIKKEDINVKLSTLLPDYMLPDRVIYMEKLPLNANGKIDRKTLKGKIG